jgi:phosphohistidine phosphatase
MAAQLWLLRHGDAEPHGARSDFERRLTERGERQAALAGAALAALGVEFELALTSPRARALQTARIACEALGVSPVEHEPLAGEFGRDQALELLQSAAAGDGRVLIVGHEPDFSQVVHDLTGARVDFKKGGIAAVRLDGGRGELLTLLRPRELAAIAGAE